MKQDVLWTQLEIYLRDPLQHWGPIKIYRAARPPLLHVICKVELHEMPSHGGEDHVAGLPIDIVGEEEQRVVRGAAESQHNYDIRCASHQNVKHLRLEANISPAMPLHTGVCASHCTRILFALIVFFSNVNHVPCQKLTSFSDSVPNCCSRLQTPASQCCSSLQHLRPVSVAASSQLLLKAPGLGDIKPGLGRCLP